jgi:predicted dehydrogenase
MTNDAIRFGILGLSMGYARAKLVPDTPGAELACVCSIEPGKAEEVGEELGCDWTTDYKEMFARDDIDCIGVWTPSGTHCDFCVEAMEAGKHAMTTKPMDITVEACNRAIETAERTDKVLGVDFGNRYLPINHQVRQMIQQGYLGDIICFDLIMKWYRTQAYYDGGSPSGWRSRTETEGGSIANQGVHFVDLMQWFMGPVKTVYGRSNTFNHDIETEDQSMALLTFDNDAWGIIHTTTCATPNLGTRIEINGTKGSLIWKDKDIQVFHSEVDPDIQLSDFEVDPDLPDNIFADMIGAIQNGEALQCDGYEGRKSVEIFEAVYNSSDTGKPVEL